MEPAGSVRVEAIGGPDSGARELAALVQTRIGELEAEGIASVDVQFVSAVKGMRAFLVYTEGEDELPPDELIPA